MKVQDYKDYGENLKKLSDKGSVYKKAADLAKAIDSDLRNFNNIKEVINERKLTNYGESRIDNCYKFQLTHGCRLIIIHKEGIVFKRYIGTHDDCEKWLEANRGLTYTVRDNQIEEIHENISFKSSFPLRNESDYTQGSLLKKISERHYKQLFRDLPGDITPSLMKLESKFDEDELLHILQELDEKYEKQRCAIIDVFDALRCSDFSEAIKRLELYNGDRKKIEDLNIHEINNIQSGDEYIEFTIDNEELKQKFLSRDFKNWMLFLHPEQKKLAERDFNGTARLLGISGSGKTTIIIHRAFYLSKKYPEEKILIVTLNKALASLITELLSSLCKFHNYQNNNIVVRSYWELCQELLTNFDHKDKEKYYNDYTWKINENITEIWKEFYQCENNNDDAKIMRDVIIYLNQQKVDPSEYLYQEMNYIRSAFSDEEVITDKYLKLEREGRVIPLNEDYRNHIIKGLNGWEKKMFDVGITDYLGLVKALFKHIDKIKPVYRCILIDEMQDFGNINLKIIRKLVSKNDNDLFLAGDYFQKVSIVYQKFTEIDGIDIVGRSCYLKKNYRNAQQILDVANSVLSNFREKILKNNNLEPLETEYSNFISEIPPRVLKADSFLEELNHAYYYSKEQLETDKEKKICIAIASMDYYQIESISQNLKLCFLDNKANFDDNSIFISDLEQTKGYEFDTVIVLNCVQDIFPDINLPKDEWYRDVLKLYVTMTRAKHELILSYHNELSGFINDHISRFNVYNWNDYEKGSNIISNDRIREISQIHKTKQLNINGNEFILSKYAIGLSGDIQKKLIKIVTGKKSTNGRTDILTWDNIDSFIGEKDEKSINKAFGKSHYYEFLEHILKKIDVKTKN